MERCSTVDGVAHKETTNETEDASDLENKDTSGGTAPKDKKEDKVLEVKILKIRDQDSHQGIKSSIVHYIRMKMEGTAIPTHA